MDVTRYITTLTIKTRDNQLIPIQDKNIEYKDDDFGELVKIEGI